MNAPGPGLSASQDWLDAVSHARGNGLREMLLRVETLHCGACVRRVEQALRPQTRSAQVNLAAGTVEVVFDPAETTPEAVMQAIEHAGYRATPIAEQPDLRETQTERKRAILRIGVAGLLGMQVMMLATTQYFTEDSIDPAMQALLRYAQWIMTTPILMYSGWPFFDSAWRALRQRSVNMDVPVAVAMLLAYSVSAVHVLLRSGHVYFDSVSMFAFLLLTARWFESSGRAEASRRLRELGQAQPLTAQRETPAGAETVLARYLHPGDVVLIGPGEAAPSDGACLSPSGELDEALITGESLPVRKRAGDNVLGGSINVGNQLLSVRITRAAQNSAVSQITRLIHRAQADKPRVQQLADRAAGYIIVAVLLLAAAGAAYWWPQGPDQALAVALAVLVVTCPCALSLATPVALAASASALARQGVLLTRPDALLRLTQVDTVCFDKTGTLTSGRMQIAYSRAFGGAAALPHCLAVAAALERGIRHPVAQAFAAHDEGLTATSVTALPGGGMRGSIESVEYQLSGIAGESGLTVLQLRQEGRPIAQFGLSHQLRRESRGIVQQLRDEGLRVQMLSGDSASPVTRAADGCGIPDARAGLSPQDKLQHLRDLQQQGHVVWMIGDGINDAPVLAGADVSASLASGAALAQSRADLLLTRNTLEALPGMLDQARRTRRVIHQNLAWAVAYNLVAVPLALSGGISPWIAAAGMGISSVTVVLNALRLLRPAAAAPGAAHTQRIAV